MVPYEAGCQVGYWNRELDRVRSDTEVVSVEVQSNTCVKLKSSYCTGCTNTKRNLAYDFKPDCCSLRGPA